MVPKVDMRAVELVLSPKFPKTNVNINASLDELGTQEAIGFLETLLK